MTTNRMLIGLAAALALGACSTMNDGGDGDDMAGSAVGPSGSAVPTMVFTEPAGATLVRRVTVQNVSKGTATDKAVNTVYFYSNGAAFAVLQGSDDAVEGQWVARNSDVCFTWPVRGQECWPNAMTLTTGQNATITSDRGVTAKLTGL